MLASENPVHTTIWPDSRIYSYASFDRDGRGRRRLLLRLDAENITNNIYRVAQESEFAAGQLSIPRLISATAKVRF